MRGRDEQVEAFLRGEPAHDAEQRHAASRWSHALPQQEIALELGLLRDVVRAEVDRQMLVVRRIPLFVVDAIQDSMHGAAARGQRLLHPHAIARRGDFARIGRAHRGHRVGMQDAVLERVDVPRLEIVLVQ